MHVQYLEDNDNYSSTVNQNESKFRSIASSSRKKVPNKVWIPSDLTYRNDESDSSQDHLSGSIIQNTSISRKVFSLLSDRDDIGKLLMKNKLATDDYENYIDRRTYEANIDEETEIFLKNTGESPQKNGNSSPCRKSKSADRRPSHSILRNKQMIVHDIENSTNYFNFERIKIFSLVIGSLQNFAKNFSLEADRLQNKN